MVRTERGGDMHRVDAGDGSPVYRHDRRGTFHARIDFDQRDPVLSTLVSVVGLATTTEPFELSPLWSALDADALEQLVAHWHRSKRNGPHTKVEFGYENCAITIRGDGEIVVTPSDESE